MPLYEYECCGIKFEEYHRIADRFNAVCPICGRPARLLVSAWGRVIFASYDTVVGHDGTILSRKQTTDTIPALPEKIHGGRF